MPLTRVQKEEQVEQLKEVFGNAMSVAVASARGLTVSQLTELRGDARTQGVQVKVARNTVVKRAVADTEFKELDSVLTGPTMLLWSDQELGTPASILEKYDTAAGFDALQVKGFCLGADLIPASELKTVAKLPTREQALSQLAGVLQAPVQKFASLLQNVPGKMAFALQAIKDQKEAG